MKNLIEQADRLLAMLSVSGDSVMLLAKAREVLGEVYRMEPGGKPGRKTADGGDDSK